MNHLSFALVAQDPDNFSVQIGRMSPQTREQLLVLGAIGFVVFIVLCWAAFFRKRPRHKRGHIKRDRYSFRKSFTEGWSELKRFISIRERQRKRVRHRPRNPTRAEVGGLPTGRNPGDAASGESPNSAANF